jgi:precorrin-4/cobalt-precorrin-4 C11-methyltransferase
VKVYLLGAGPGDPELLTIKAQRIIRRAAVIIYAASLVNPRILEGHQEEACLHDSSRLHLEQIFALYHRAHLENQDVARIHSGDPSLYGAIGEQMAWLEKEGIEYEVIPGVSSFCAAAASLQRELTAPGISQTVILTRLRGRTPVPAREEFVKLAKHQATMVIFLSVHQIERLVSQLLEGGYSPQTPAAVVVRASWPNERKILTTIGELIWRVTQAGIRKTALIIVGQALRPGEHRSLLYDPEFSHEYREEL